MILTYDDFDKEVDKKIESVDYKCNLYCILRCAHTLSDLQKEPFMFEPLFWEYETDSYTWENDWYEGEKYVELFAIFTEPELIEFIKRGIENEY